MIDRSPDALVTTSKGTSAPFGGQGQALREVSKILKERTCSISFRNNSTEPGAIVTLTLPPKKFFNKLGFKNLMRRTWVYTELNRSDDVGTFLIFDLKCILLLA
jgi:hypothetical protein